MVIFMAAAKKKAKKGKKESPSIFRGKRKESIARASIRKGKGVNELTSSEVNPIHEVHFVGNMWAPSTGWKDCRCEIRKAGEAPRA